jgi:Fe-S cluster assembly protein SufD
VTQHYVAAYRAFAGNGAAGAPPWLRELRDRSIARFDALGFPTTKQEEWRFTNVAPIAEKQFRLPKRDAARPAPAAIAPYLMSGAGPATHQLVFVNGYWSPALSTLDDLPASVQVTSIGEAVEREPALFERHFARSGEQGAFTALNTAFLSDGAFVHVPAGVELPAPLQILFFTVPGAEPLVTHPRTLVFVERSAKVAIVETYAAAGDGIYWTNAVTELVAEEGARVDWHRVQREAVSAYHTASTHTRQGRDAVVHLHTVALGASLARHDVRLTLEGQGGQGILNGLYLLRGSQHVDHHTWIDHAAPHCETHEYFNGVLDGESRSVFNGRIIVRPGAQRTDSKQTNNNLLLSAGAHADSQPQLEIYADDVKCTHGSTTGPLDDRVLFYLRSRGLDADSARRLLTYGFAAEILERMEVAPLREQLDTLVRERAGAGV